MEAFHNSRCDAYRTPFGSVPVGTQVTLAIDVWDAGVAAVTLRTWVDGVGEELFPMRVADADDNENARADDDVRALGGANGNGSSAGAGVNGPVRYQTSITPVQTGIVWYHFIIVDAHGNSKRYGARDGRVGGEGQLRDWEPPSFQLTVHEAFEFAPAWHAPVSGYVNDDGADHALAEFIEVIRENYPANAFEDVFPWGCVPLGEGAKVASIDCSRPLDVGGAFPCFAANDDVFGFWSCDAGGGTTCVLVNTSRHRWHDVFIPMVDEAVVELLSGYDVTAVPEAEAGAPACTMPGVDRYARAYLPQLGAVVLHFHPRQRLGQPMQAGVGVLAHITSLPAPGQTAITQAAQDERGSAALDDACAQDSPEEGARVQDAAEAARRLAVAEGADDHMARCIQAVEAVLGDAGLSVHDVIAQATAAIGTGRTLFGRASGSLGAPARAFVDWLAAAGMRYWQILPVNPTDDHGSPYAGISAFAGNVRLLEGDAVSITYDLASFDTSDEFRAFCSREADWLLPYSYFMAIRHKLGTRAVWQNWPLEYRSYDLEFLQRDRELKFYAGAWQRAQFFFEQQWQAIRAYANERGIQIIGDIPIYVSADSADAWSRPELFQLDDDGMALAVAGCPPDSFAADGQVWGNPLYDWQAMREDGYAWWLRRLERTFSLYDFVRLDHFIGFSRYFSIPAGQKASEGAYVAGPGLELFEHAHRKFGPLPIIAEDLGTITPGVRALGATCGFPGMDIVQFADGNDPLSGYWPRPEKIAYTGTHDNQTLVGYVAERYGAEDAAKNAQAIATSVAQSSADICVFPLQDLALLDDEARMNVPGTSEGNWQWRATARDLAVALPEAQRLVKLHAAGNER